MKTEQVQVNNNTGNYFKTKRRGNKTLDSNEYQCYFTKQGEIAFLRQDEMSCAHCRKPIRYGERNYIMEDEQNNPKGTPPKKPRLEKLVQVEKPYTHVQLHGYKTDRKSKDIDQKYMRNIKTNDLTGADLEYYKEHGEVRSHRKTEEEKKAPLLGTRTTQNHVYCSKCYPKIKSAKEL